MLLGLRSGEMDRACLLGTTCSPRHWSLTSQWPGEKFSVRVAVNDPETYQTVTQQISLVALRIELIYSTSSKQVPLLDVLLNISSITSYLGPPKSAKCRRRLHFPLARPRKRPMHTLSSKISHPFQVSSSYVHRNAYETWTLRLGSIHPGLVGTCPDFFWVCNRTECLSMWATQDVPGVGTYVYRVRPTQNLSEEKKTTGNGIGCYLRWCLFLFGRNGKEVLWMKGKLLVRKTSGP